jgi:hypothetical protein
MLVYCFSFSVVLPTVTVPQQAQGDCAVSMDQRQLRGEEWWRSAVQHSTAQHSTAQYILLVMCLEELLVFLI